MGHCQVPYLVKSCEEAMQSILFINRAGYMLRLSGYVGSYGFRVDQCQRHLEYKKDLEEKQ